jgi:hypothetical protein
MEKCQEWSKQTGVGNTDGDTMDTAAIATALHGLFQRHRGNVLGPAGTSAPRVVL